VDIEDCLAENESLMKEFRFREKVSEGFIESDKRLPVFSDSKSRNPRYCITDNFLEGRVSVVNLARDTARKPPDCIAQPTTGAPIGDNSR